MASNAYQLQRFVEIMESWGLSDVLLPFSLIFLLIYAILSKTQILGAGRKNLNVALSIIFAALVVIPHILGSYPPNGDIVDIINKAIPNVSLIVVAIVMVLILIGILGGEAKWLGGSLSGWIALAAIVSVVWIFGAAAGWWTGSNWFYRFFGADAVAIIVMLLVFALIVWWITKDTGEKAAEGASSIIKNLGDWFSRGGGHGGH